MGWTVCLSVVLACDRRNVPFWLPSLRDSQWAWTDRNQSVFLAVFVILTPLEKPLPLSSPRENVVQSVRRRQREMHECAGALKFTWNFSVLDFYPFTQANTTHPHTLSSQYHTHTWFSTCGTYTPHTPNSSSVYACVSTEQRCTNLRGNQPIGMLRPEQHWMLRWNSALGITRPRTSSCSSETVGHVIITESFPAYSR